MNNFLNFNYDSELKFRISIVPLHTFFKDTKLIC